MIRKLHNAAQQEIELRLHLPCPVTRATLSLTASIKAKREGHTRTFCLAHGHCLNGELLQVEMRRQRTMGTIWYFIFKCRWRYGTCRVKKLFNYIWLGQILEIFFGTIILCLLRISKLYPQLLKNNIYTTYGHGTYGRNKTHYQSSEHDNQVFGTFLRSIIESNRTIAAIIKCRSQPTTNYVTWASPSVVEWFVHHSLHNAGSFSRTPRRPGANS